MDEFLRWSEGMVTFALVLVTLALACEHRRNWPQWRSVLLWLALFGGTYRLLESVIGNFVFYLAALFACALSYTLVFQRGAFYHRVCLCVVGIFSIVAIKSLVLSARALFSGASEAGMAGMTPVDYLLFYLTYLLCAAYLVRFYPDKQTHLPPRYWVLFSAATAFSAVMIYLSVEFSMSTSISAALSTMLYLVNLGLILLIYYLTYLVSENYARVLHAQAVEQRHQIQIQQLQQTSDMIDRVRRERHELKNTYFYIGGLVKAKRYDELEHYLDTELSARTSGMEEFQTGNTLVDFLLTQKVNEARQKNIRIMTSVAPLSKLFVQEEDLCALLANLLDNAIEASMDRQDGDVQLFLDWVKGYLRVRVRNRAEEAVLRENPSLCTTKEDRERHGIGLPVVRSIAAKYQGDFDTRWENGYFCATVMLLSVDRNCSTCSRNS